MDKKTLKEEIIKFRDLFKEYQTVVRSMWVKRNRYNDDSEEIQKIREELETPLREQLVEMLGKLEKYMQKMGVSMYGSLMGRTFPIFDHALESKIFDNPTKGESLNMAVQMAIKAVGMVDSMDEKEFSRLSRKTPVVFVSYNFADKNKDLSSSIISFLETQNVAILVGSEPGSGSVSEKVRGKIDDSDIVVGVMTADEENNKGQWSASKWIREELAYALAKPERVVIRMIEEGCDTDGRIFGDREYISFERTNLTTALIKLAAVLQKHINN